MLLDRNASSPPLEMQVSEEGSSALDHLCLVSQSYPFVGKRDLSTTMHALLRSRLVQCNVLYVGILLKSVQKLQVL